MKLNKLGMAAVAFAALSTTGLSAAIDPDIAGKNGLALKQYAMVLKHRPRPQAHHVALAGSDIDELLKDIETATGNADIYIAAEVVRARTRGLAALTALGNDGQNLFAAVVGGAGQPADVTVGAFKAAFSAAFDAAVGAQGASVLVPEPAGPNLRQLQACIEGVDAATQLLIQPWITALHGGGLAQTNVLDAARSAAIVAITGSADTLQDFSNYLQDAIITH